MEHFQNFKLCELNDIQNIIWKGVWIAIVWTVWNYANKIIFNQGKVDVHEIFCIAQLNAWVWLTHKVFATIFFYSNWVLCPKLCIKNL